MSIQTDKVVTLPNDRPAVESSVAVEENIGVRSGPYNSKKFVHDVFFSNLPIPFLKFRTYLWLIAFSYTLGVAGYGEWSILMVTLALATGLSSFNLGSSMTRFLCGEKTDNEISQAWTTVFLLIVVASVIGGLSVTLLWQRMGTHFASHSGLRTPGFLLALALITDLIYEEERGLLRARRYNQQWAALTLGRTLGDTAATIGVAWISHNVVAVMEAYCICSALAAIIGWIYSWRVVSLRFAKPSLSVLKLYGSYGIGLMPGMLASMLSVNGDRYLVAHYLDLRHVGIYSIVVAISNLVGFLVGPINDVLVPELSVLYDHGHWDLFYRRLRGIQKFVWGSCAGVATLLIVFPAEVVRLFGTRDCTEGLAALSISGLESVFLAVVMLQIVVLNVELKVWWSSGFWAGMAVLTLASDLVLVPRLGITGAAIGQCLAAFIAVVLLMVVNRQTIVRTFSPLWIFQMALGAAFVYGYGALVGHGSLTFLSACGRLLLSSALLIASMFATGFVKWDDARRSWELISAQGHVEGGV
jgi:O-antigen/teichoic acid export membrane protein